MKNEIFERLNLILTTNNYSQNRLSKESDLGQTAINRQLKGQAQLSANLISVISSKFPTVSMEWLIRGNGEMLLNDAPATSSPQPVADDLPKEGEPVPNYDTTISVLVEAINNLNKVIAAQEQRIHELEAIVNDDDVQ